MHDVVDGRFPDPELHRQTAVRCACCCQFANRCNVGRRELGRVYPFASQLTALRHHVRRVVRRVTQKEVIGSHAVPDVTPMQDALALRDGSEMQFPGHAMYEQATIPAMSDSAVTPPQQGTRPQPASGRGFFDSLPKPDTERDIAKSHERPFYRWPAPINTGGVCNVFVWSITG